MRKNFAASACLGLFALVGCDSGSGALPTEVGPHTPAAPLFDEAELSDWSSPTNLGAPVNTTLAEIGAYVSRDGLSLYFARIAHPDDFGGTDLVVSRRADTRDSWGPPVNLGPAVNTGFNETAPSLSLDGHRLFFNSNRPGGFGGNDLYVSTRRGEPASGPWGAPENLGSGVNTSANESQPVVFEEDATELVTLFFASDRAGGDDIYAATLQADETFGATARVDELSSAGVDRQPAIRRDGLEIYLASNRTGTLGGLDLWVATRPTTADRWSIPLNLGPTVNSAFIDARPALSFDGTELYFQSNANRPGATGPCFGDAGPCFFDLYRTTRTKLID